MWIFRQSEPRFRRQYNLKFGSMRIFKYVIVKGYERGSFKTFFTHVFFTILTHLGPLFILVCRIFFHMISISRRYLQGKEVQH